MCTALEELMNEGKLEGRREGRLEGIQATISTCKSFNASKDVTVKNLMKVSTTSFQCKQNKVSTRDGLHMHLKYPDHADKFLSSLDIFYVFDYMANRSIRHSCTFVFGL